MVVNGVVTTSSSKLTPRLVTGVKTLILITILTCGLSPVPTIAATSSEDTIIDPEIYKDLLTKIVTKIEEGAVYDNLGLIGWPVSVNGSENELYASGYSLGMAGIGQFLLDLRVIGIDVSSTLIADVVHSFTVRSEMMGPGVAWSRMNNISAGYWTGVRYGTSGILPFLVRARSMGFGGNTTQLEYDAYRWLWSRRESEGNFYIDEAGLTTTDLVYGTSGVGIGLLETYHYTRNQTYLDSARVLGDWLVKVATPEGDGYNIPWSFSDDQGIFDVKSYTGLGSGVAGSLEFFVDLYQISPQASYLEMIRGLSQYLVDHEQNGVWKHCSIGYISPVGNTDGLTGVLTGATGIALALLRAYPLIDLPEILEVVARVENNVNLLTTAKGQVWISQNYKDKRSYTGYDSGEAGIAYFHLQLYREFGLDRNLEYANLIVSHLTNLFNIHGMIPISETKLGDGYTYNIESGLAGVGEVLLRGYNLTKGNASEEYSSIYDENSGNHFYIDPVLRNILLAAVLMILVVSFRKFKQLSES